MTIKTFLDKFWDSYDFLLILFNMLVIDKSRKAFKEASESIPGSVNSPVRAFGAVGGNALFIESGHGCYINDIDGNRYVDYVCSWGPLILGHLDKTVIRRVKDTLKRGTSFGAPTELETQLAQLIKEAMPSVEKVRMVNSGTEATMSAIRLARGYTKRDLVIKFEGCYHGHVDGLLVQAGSGATTLGVPTSPGVPQDYIRNTITIPFNNLDAIKEVCRNQGAKIACIIIEPVAGNMGVVPPKKGYLKGLRNISDKYGIVLIFDEVMTGFRVAHGGAQELFKVTPDLTTLGKIIGGGLPVGAYGGKAEIMDCVSPNGPVYQAGTLSGNPLAMASGIATLEKLKKRGIYKKLERRSKRLSEGLKTAASDAGILTYHTRVGSMLCTFF
ncbi:MAG: glutamate-1-semialdehyde-2,1-aminomutase [Candidatus Scalindua rubra]|uniref:Glutamate-1-semialdehyde 2,1-aminomutase n=1 Tax=Candidatus Scalindua rubra TaxID=1872076 RepID=A0A1E3X6A5_9BACT|nr:MAG: glutamate-1-semialdehyde-2,1-aminomutase [Candidatus Scalindua rubra]